MHYLGFDLETGGYDKKNHTITEAYFAIWDKEWNLLDELHSYLKNNDGEIHGEEQAFKATGIDPKELLASPDTLTYNEFNIKLKAMLERHKIPNKRVHYRYLGQNIVYFDIPFMEEQRLFTEKEAANCGIGHNALDTTSIVTWLKDIGVLPPNVGSISSLIQYFELQKQTAHRAKDDTHMQKEIYIRLCDLIRKITMANLQTAGQDSDLLKIVEF